MAQDLNGSAGIAVFNRGPMDGKEHPTEGETAELCVVMNDGQIRSHALATLDPSYGMPHRLGVLAQARLRTSVNEKW